MSPISSYISKLSCFGTKPKSTPSTNSKPSPKTYSSDTKYTNMAPVVLILGSGPRVGASVAEAFKNGGYNVALASRKGTNSKTDDGYFSIKADFASPSSLPDVFSAVKSEFGSAPSVVIYNAAALTPPSDPSSVLSVSAEAVTKDLNINVVSPYVAAQQAIAAWETLPQDDKKTFIYTGNAQNDLIIPMPAMMNLGIGKAASAYWVGLADTLYKAKGYRFVS
jgi:NAD(P)-dependent dehydrogenase (short-subunit alcohol dehydrogenase family)